MMSRSADVSGMHDTASWRDFQRGVGGGPFHGHTSHDFSNLSAASPKPITAVEETVMLEALLPVFAKLEDREEVCRNLGIFVQTGRGGSNGLSRKVTVRLIDPTDPFFLFELELLEDDYGSFKQRLELLVDFSGFPKYLVSMINSIVNGVTPYAVSFVVDNRDALRGTLRVLEKTDFRTVEHISLMLMRQGDAGQKRYLAERFQYFEREYNQLAEERRLESGRAISNIEELKREVTALEGERAQLRESLRLELAKSDKNHLADTNQLREEHAKQLTQLRTSLESELRHVTQKAEELQKQLLEDVRVKDKGLQEARQRAASLESTLLALQSQMRLTEDKCNAQSKELEGLRSSNEELLNFRQQAMRSMSDGELNSVKLQERQRGLIETLKSRDDELKTIREQYDKQDTYIHILTSQNEQMTERNKKSEASLAKAHHIIAMQLKHIQKAKEKNRMVGNQLHSQDALLQEKVSAISRLREELASISERAQVLQNKNTELRDQLAKTDSAREKLAQELKQSQDALIHLQRSTSVNGRHWSSAFGGLSTTGAGGLSSSSYGSHQASFDVYREFNKNASTTLRGGTWPMTSSTVPHDMPTAPQVQETPTSQQKNSEEKSSKPQQISQTNGVGATPLRGDGGGIHIAPNGVPSIGSSPSVNMRQPLDKAAINVLGQSNQILAAKSFFHDTPARTELNGNTASFVGKVPTPAPSAYF